MPDKPWKAWEREVALLIGGRRFAANSGAEIDAEGDLFVAQCKLVSRLSLEDVTRLALAADDAGTKRNKLGVVGIKLKQGKGHPATGLMVMTVDVWAKLKALVDPPR